MVWPFCFFTLTVGELVVGTVGGCFGSSCLMFGIMGVDLLLAIVRAVLKEVFWNPCSLLRSRGGGEGEVVNRGKGRREEEKKKRKQRLKKRK